MLKRGLNNEAIRGLISKIRSPQPTHTYSKIPNSLMSTLESHSGWGGPILTVGVNDDISSSLGIPHNNNGVLYWHYGTTFNETSPKVHPLFDPTTVFHDVNFIFLGNYEMLGTAKKFYSIYESYIATHYNEIYSDDNFKVYAIIKQ